MLFLIKESVTGNTRTINIQVATTTCLMLIEFFNFLLSSTKKFIISKSLLVGVSSTCGKFFKKSIFNIKSKTIAFRNIETNKTTE